MIAAILTLIGILIIAAFVASYFACKHVWGTPISTGSKSEWYLHEYTVPQLPGEKIRCYRQDETFVSICLKCGETKEVIGYNQKPHDEDTMHKPAPDWVPEPKPWETAETRADK